MPKTVYFPRQVEDKHSGISITWTKSRQMLDVSGWYDQFVEIEGDCPTLKEFFDVLGITNKEVLKALKEGDA